MNISNVFNVQKTKCFYGLICFISSSVFISCSSDNDNFLSDDEAQEVSPVVFNINEVPYPALSDYNFFKTPITELKPVYGVIPYEPVSALFSDYAKKKRFIWMPEGVSANYDSDGEALDFPVGTVLIKNFYYENVLPGNTTKLLETRLMIKKTDGWIFANYTWNEQQTDAFYEMEGSFVPVTWNQDGEIREVNYRIPNSAECFTCHNKSEIPLPIGPKPQNLNKFFPYETGVQNQLEKLKDFGYLNSYPGNILTLVDYHNTSQPLDLRVRSYLDINCAHCHSDNGFCNYRAPRFAFNQTLDPEHLGICIVPDEDISDYVDGYPTHIIKPGHHEESEIFYRMNTTQANIKMPSRGRTLIHKEGVQMVSEWIDSLEGDCE